MIVAAITLLNGLVLTALGMRYPSLSVIEYSQVIAGRFLGRVVGLIFIAFFLLVAVITSRDFSELYVIHILPETPLPVLIAFILLLAVYALFSGLEVLARTSEILVPVSLLIVMLGVLGVLPLSNYREFLPVLGNGWAPVLMDSLTQLPYSGYIISWLFLLPYIGEKGKAGKTLLISIAVHGLILLTVSATVVAFIGAKTIDTLNYKFYTAFQMISFLNVIERIEISFVLTWTFASFLTITLFCHAAVLFIKQWLGVKSPRAIIVIAAVSVLVLSLLMFPSYIHFRRFMGLDRFGVFAIPIVFGIPLLLLIVDTIKKWLKLPGKAL